MLSNPPEPRRGKRSLYRIADPFLRLSFRVVAPHRSILAAAPRERRLDQWRAARTSLFSATWEELCRLAAPRLACVQQGFLPAARLWGAGGPEWDVVSTTSDGASALLGEVKWHEGVATGDRVRAAASALMAKGVPPTLLGKRVVHAVFLPQVDPTARDGAPCAVIDASDALAALSG